MTDPQWSTSSSATSMFVSWAPVAGAEWYEVRLEGAGEAREVLVDDPSVIVRRASCPTPAT